MKIALAQIKVRAAMPAKIPSQNIAKKAFKLFGIFFIHHPLRKLIPADGKPADNP